MEGPIDSLFLDNCIASADASLTSDLTSDIFGLGVNIENAVIVYDNEPRNQTVCKQINKAINQNFAVCIWPKSWEYKDLNDAVLAGYSPDSVQKIIDDNTHRGMKAQLMLNAWRKT